MQCYRKRCNGHRADDTCFALPEGSADIVECPDRISKPKRRADAAASGGVRSKPLLAGERSDARGKGETGWQAPGVSGTSAIGRELARRQRRGAARGELP